MVRARHPGRRETKDEIEAEAIALAQRLESEADLPIAITDAATPGRNWIEPRSSRGDEVDLATRSDADIQSRAQRDGLEELVRASELPCPGCRSGLTGHGDSRRPTPNVPVAAPVDTITPESV